LRKNLDLSLIQHRNPCPQGKVRVQWLCHLNDSSATHRTLGYFRKGEEESRSIKLSNYRT
jgi:hypothetical protein